MLIIDNQVDKASYFHRRSLMLKVVQALQLHRIRQSNLRKLRNERATVSNRHPLYMVALLKRRTGTLTQYLQASDQLLDKQQIKLEVLFKSLYHQHRLLRGK